MVQTDQFVVGADLEGLPVGQALRLANRHGLIAGATGTGKTVTLQRLIETFSDAGVAVFAADVKGDLCGLGAAGAPQGKVAERIASMPWLNHQPMAYPVTLWDVQGKSGHPLRTTLSEPALQLEDILHPDRDGRGRIHLLDASRLVHEAPKVYATFLLWLLAELFEQLPERGDADKPLLALFFDEAHLLFADTPKALQERLEQVVRLIRSKGVGVYFVTQSPGDLPDDVLAQLGLRIQHGLRAFTAKEQKSLRAVADGFRPNPAIDTLTVLTELGIGEALVGTLEAKGTPAMVQRVAVAPPQSRIGPLSESERAALIQQSALRGRYDKPIDRESAYELLTARAEQATQQAESSKLSSASKSEVGGGMAGAAGELLGGLASQVMKTAMRQAANQIGRQLVRGLLGSLMGGKRR
jgi:DNA helicase HerA-like ATPase